MSDLSKEKVPMLATEHMEAENASLLSPANGGYSNSGIFPSSASSSPPSSSAFSSSSSSSSSSPTTLSTRIEGAGGIYADSNRNKVIGTYILFTLLNRMFLTIQYSYTSYPNFVNLYWTALQIPMFWFLTWKRQKTIPLTKVEKEIKWYVWWGMAGLTALDSVIISVAISNLAGYGALQVLLSQARIPFSMATTKIFLPKTKYSVSQYIGAIIVILGILFSMLPDLMNQQSASADQLPWIGLYLLHCIPSSLVFVYTEYVLQGTEVDSMYLNWKVQIPTLVFTIALLVPSAAIDGVPISELGDNLYRGAQCQFGITPDGDSPCDLAPVFTHLYIFINTAWNLYNVMMIGVTSANTTFIASTLTVPMAALLFAIPGIPAGKSITLYTLLGLVVICLGVAIYRSYAQLRRFVVSRFPRLDGLGDQVLATIGLGDGSIGGAGGGGRRYGFGSSGLVKTFRETSANQYATDAGEYQRA